MTPSPAARSSEAARSSGTACSSVSATERRVLVYRLGSLGDMLVAVPSLRLVRRAFPAAEVRLLTNLPVSRKAPPAAAVLEGSGLLDGYVRYAAGTRRPGDLLRLWWTLLRWRPEVVVYLAAARGVAAARRDGRFFRLCGVRRCVGVPLSEAMQANLYGSEPGSPEAGLYLRNHCLEPEAARLARNLSGLGDACLGDPKNWDLRLSDAEDRAAEEAIGAELGGRPLLAVSVGTKVQAKDWGRENWRALLGAIAGSFPEYGLLLAGAPEESASSEWAAEGWRAAGGGPVVNLCGRLTPRESGAAFRRARLFLGHDSGPMHLAAAVGTPCVAIFAARNIPRQWFPYGEGHRIVYHAVDCGGCGLETCIDQRKKCLLSIGVAEVFREVEAALANTTRPGSAGESASPEVVILESASPESASPDNATLQNAMIGAQ